MASVVLCAASFGPSRDHESWKALSAGVGPGEQPDRVALTVDVEANDVALVVDAVEGRRELPIEQPDVEARPCLGFPCRVVAPCTQSSFPPHLDAQHNIRPRKRGLIRKSVFFFENLNCNNVTPGDPFNRTWAYAGWMERPLASIHYHKSLGEFRAWFPTDADCLDYLEWLRWPHGFVCPSCGC